MTLSLPQKTNLFLFLLLFFAPIKNIVLCQVKKTPLEQLRIEACANKNHLTPIFYTNQATEQSPPEMPFSVSLVSTGTFYNPARVELVACVTHPEDREIEKVEF